MRKFYFFVLGIFLFLQNELFAQAFSATYDFSDVTTSSGTTDPTPPPTVSGLTLGSFTAVGTPANPNAGGRFSFQDWSLGATNGSDVFSGGIDFSEYYQVTITPDANISLDISSITFTLQRSGAGIRQYAIRGSVGGYADNLPASINPANPDLSVVPVDIFQVSDGTTSAEIGSTITLGAGYTNITSAVTFRFYGFNAEGTGGTFSIDNVTFNGSATYTGTITGFYSKSTGNLTNVATWGINPDGTGTQPTNFTDDGQVFHIANRTATVLDADWVVSGTVSKVVVLSGETFIIPTTATLTGLIDVAMTGTLRLENDVLPDLGTMDPYESTVIFAQTTSPYVVPTGTEYWNLVLEGGVKTFASGIITVNKILIVDGVTGLNGSGDPYTTIRLGGDFILQNGAAFAPPTGGDGNRFTLICTGTFWREQTLSGGPFYLFALRVEYDFFAPPTKIILGSSANLRLGNLSGGGLDLQNTGNVLDLNGNDLTLYGAAIFYVNHVGSIWGHPLSNLTINKTTGAGSIRSTAFTSGFQNLNNFSYHSAGIGSNDFTFKTPLTIHGNLSMTAGHIILDAYDLHVKGTASGATSSYVSTNSTGSFVLDNVTTTRTAPVGNSTFNGVTINNAAGADWAIRVEDLLYVDDPDFVAYADHAVQREWHITPSVSPATVGPIDIAFRYNDGDLNQVTSLFDASAPAQVWYELDFGPYGTHWIATMSPALPSGTPGTYRTLGFTGWQTNYPNTAPYTIPFAISTEGNPLPVNLITFNAAKTGSSQSRITWEMATPLPGAVFEVQKSTDSRNYTGIGTVSGHAANRSFTFTDNQLGRGITYYRLKITEAGGSVSYSRIVPVINEAQGLWVGSLSPNPVRDRAQLTISAAQAGTAQLVIYNISGAAVRQWQTGVQAGSLTKEIDVRGLPAGVYHLSVTVPGGHSVIRFVKQ